MTGTPPTPLSIRPAVAHFSRGPQGEDYIGFYGEENRGDNSAWNVTAGAVDTIGHSGIIGVIRFSGWIRSHCNSNAARFKPTARVPESSRSAELQGDLAFG